MRQIQARLGVELQSKLSQFDGDGGVDTALVDFFQEEQIVLDRALRLFEGMDVFAENVQSGANAPSVQGGGNAQGIIGGFAGNVAVRDLPYDSLRDDRKRLRNDSIHQSHVEIMWA